jgi:Ca2+-binding EF-hand superfamily protein
MKYAWPLLALTLMPWLFAGGQPRTEAVTPLAGDEQDLIFFHDSRPFLVRLHLQVDGRPFRALWDDYFDHLFRFLDYDGDDVLSRKELAQAPSLQQLLQQLHDPIAVDPGPAPDLAAVDLKPADGKVSREELAAYYRRVGAGPLQLELIHVRLGDDPLTDALFQHLDRTKDGQLSREELLAAPTGLGRIDQDDNEIITLSELLPGRELNPYVYSISEQSGLDYKLFPWLLPARGDRGRQPAPWLLHWYDRDQDGKLNRAEVGFDRIAFEQLDANGDGELDESELTRWAQRPDAALLVQLGRPAGEQAVTQIQRGPGGESAFTVQQSERGARLVLRDTQLDLHRNRHPALTTPEGRRPTLERLRAHDTNKDGFLDSAEVYQPPFALVALLRLVDRDGDGRLSDKELAGYVEFQGKAHACRIVLTLADRGSSLFEFLDADRDGRLRLRELRSAWERLSAWDRNGDGCLARDELPRRFLLTLSRGQPTFTGGPVAAPGYGPAGQPKEEPRGPLWFRKMDRNSDGDVSPREFLGTSEDFQRLDLNADGLIDANEADRSSVR